MKTTLEDMARAMCVRGWGRDAISEVEWEAAAEYWMPVARAALMAIRTPDDSMMDAANERDVLLCRSDALQVWDAMIGAILEGKA